MPEAAIDLYCDAFVARERHELDRDRVVLIAPGVRGVAVIRLLITDDSGYDRLAADISGPWRGIICAFERAQRCNELMRGQPGWSASHPEMAMVLRDVQAVTGPSLPDGLDLRPVNRGSSKAPDGVPLKEALAVAMASDPSATESAEDAARYFDGLPDSARLFAAVDENGVVRATAACHVFGEYAQLFFVNTEPAWRRRGIGQAITVGVLREAASLGARNAILHATELGASVYKRVGLVAVNATRYSFSE